MREFYVENSHELFENYSTHYTDLPFLIELSPDADGEYHPGKFVVAADLDVAESDTQHAVFKPVMFDRATGEVVVPPGTLGHRFSEDGVGKWNLDLGDIDPALSLLEHRDDVAEVLMPRFDTAGQGGRGDAVRGVPIKRIGERVVTTVYDLLLAEYGVGREGLPGEWAQGLDDAEALYTPAWQEEITSVPGPAVARIAREFAQNALDSGGRSMIIMGAGTNHWFHSDTIYRTFLTLTNLCATQGVNGGGWAHYVGQEKVRPITGWMHLANALDWARPPRQMTQTTYWYMHTSQWRYDQFGADTLTATTGAGKFAGTSTADAVALSARLGWQPFYPQFDVSSLEISDQAATVGKETIPYLVDALKSGEINFAVEDPDAPENIPRIWAVWRANTLGSSGRGSSTSSSTSSASTTPSARRRPPRSSARRTSSGGRSHRRGRWTSSSPSTSG